MIDKLPIDLFHDDDADTPATIDPTSVAPPSPQSATTTGPWCAATVPTGSQTCPGCEARIPIPEPVTTARHDGICQWCGATIVYDIDACPDCGWDARGDCDVELPGLTTPFSEEQIRTLYGGDDAGPDTGDSIDLAANIIRLIISND